MNMKKLLIMIGIIIALQGSSAMAEKPDSINQRLKAVIDKLVQQLGDNNWQTRESAQKELTKLGLKLINQYRQTKLAPEAQIKLESLKDEINTLAQVLREVGQGRDAEIRMRADHIRQCLYSRTQPKIAFVSEQDGNREIYIMDADGKNQKRLTENKGLDMSPTWSPDGTMIAFASARKGTFDIYVMNADGKMLNENGYITEAKRVLTNLVDAVYPTWSPDGTKIAFVSGSEIYVMGADGKKPKRLTENQAIDKMPVWGPDGTKIAFLSARDGIEWGIYVMDVDGQNQKQLTKNKVCDWPPAWSPDGTKIAFTSDRDGNQEIYVIDVDGKNQRNLSQNKVVDDWSPAWSPEGTKIAFVSWGDTNWEIYVMDIDGKNRKRLTKNKVHDSSPTWNPSGLEEIAALFQTIE